MTRTTIVTGSRVRLTGRYLRSTGQHCGGEGASVWAVQAITPNGWAVTDERHPPEYVAAMWTAGEVAADPSLAFRRIALGNLEIARGR